MCKERRTQHPYDTDRSSLAVVEPVRPVVPNMRGGVVELIPATTTAPPVSGPEIPYAYLRNLFRRVRSLDNPARHRQVAEVG